MWYPLPKPKVSRRPRPFENFNHQRRKLVKRKNPLEFRPENHYGDRYFGIRHSDITDYLEKQVPTHAFAPSNINTGPPTNHGRGKIGEQVRPSTAPAAIPWFGRASSDVSDWLRQIPPSHLGLDPDNKPLPYFPTKSSIVTDNRWQTRDFPPMPNILWHYWAERPSSAPLATSPQRVQLDTIMEAIKKNRPKAKSNSLEPEPGRPSGESIKSDTPRSARSNPQSRAESPFGADNDKGANTSRPSSAGSGRHQGRSSHQHGSLDVKVRDSEIPAQSCQCRKRQAGCGSMTSNGVKGVDVNGSPLCKSCSCGKPQVSPPSPTDKCQEFSPRSDKGGNNHKSTMDLCQGNRSNMSVSGSSAETPRPATPKEGDKKPTCASQRPPPCPITHKQRANRCNRIKTPPVPFHEVIRNSRKAPDNHDLFRKANGKGNEWATAEEFRLMSPHSHATKVVWEDNFQKQNKGRPWPINVH